MGFSGVPKGPTSSRIAGAGLAALLAATPVFAQRNQPIYPAFDGYVKNADGSYILAFGYFSHNAELVAIPPGHENSYPPAPGDRQQPTTFRPGHVRFQCVMVVGPEFDGNLVWTLSYAGTTTGTSQKMLQSNWNLVEGARELRAIDAAAAPKGVCLNRAPEVRILGLTAGRETPRMSAALNERLSLFGSVHDEGLPRGATVVTAWKQLSGPGEARFENAAAARTRVTFSAPGAYELELSATDSLLAEQTRVIVDVK